MTSTDSSARSANTLVGPILIGLALIVMLISTWGTWPDCMYDVGSQLYIPWQLSKGKHLYTDIAFFNGPLSQYFNAFMFLIFGVSLRTLIWVNLIIFIFTLTILYWLILQISSS